MLVFEGMLSATRRKETEDMAAKKASKQATPRKSARSTPKRAFKQARPKRAAPSLISQAKKVALAVVTSAAEAVQGVMESGKKAAGVGQGGDKGSKKLQGKSRKRASKQ